MTHTTLDLSRKSQSPLVCNDSTLGYGHYISVKAWVSVLHQDNAGAAFTNVVLDTENAQLLP